MASHNDLGRIGEQIAADYLTERGYQILERDWRSGRRDLDIIALKDGILIIVEVKTRSNNVYGDPEDAVDTQKIRSIVQSTQAYLRLKHLDCDVQFDIISLTGNTDSFEIRHFENAFYPPLW